MIKAGIIVKKRITVLCLVLALCAGLTVPVMADTWDTSRASWAQETLDGAPALDFWKHTLQIDTVYSSEYIKTGDWKPDVVCYCNAPAKVTLLETVYSVDLGGSVRRCTIGDDGEILYGDWVKRTRKVEAYTWDGISLGDEYSAAGTCWDLSEGIYYMFGMAGGSLYLVVGDSGNAPSTAEPEEPDTPAISFTDVVAGSWCYEPVCWAVQQEITLGTGNGQFSPARTCSQAQILTFLWRAAGQPEVESGGNPYNNTAVTSGQYYYKALIWAWDNGIVQDAELDPGAPCKRSDVVTYLWKLAQQPAADAAAFTDVPTDAVYADAVAWAVETGITKGTGTSTFSPEMTCNRGQIVTFLYRYFIAT